MSIDVKLFDMLKIKINCDMPKFLSVDNQVYTRTCLFTSESNDSQQGIFSNNLSIHDSEILQIGFNDPGNDWAIHNCFDHLVYIFKSVDHLAYSVKLATKVYLTKEQITFWRLKCKR